MAEEIYELQARLCRAMGNAARIEMVHLLQEGPKPVGEISARLGMNQATVSRHLASLRSVGMVTTQREGHFVVYQIANPKVLTICEMMREVLAEEAAEKFRLLKPTQG